MTSQHREVVPVNNTPDAPFGVPKHAWGTQTGLESSLIYHELPVLTFPALGCIPGVVHCLEQFPTTPGS